MTALEVYRGTGGRRGDDVVDPLAASDACRLARGRAEMDERGQRRNRVTAETIGAFPGARPGALTRVEADDGAKIGDVASVRHTFEVGDDGAVVSATHVEIKRPLG